MSKDYLTLLVIGLFFCLFIPAVVFMFMLIFHIISNFEMLSNQFAPLSNSLVISFMELFIIVTPLLFLFILGAAFIWEYGKVKARQIITDRLIRKIDDLYKARLNKLADIENSFQEVFTRTEALESVFDKNVDIFERRFRKAKKEIKDLRLEVNNSLGLLREQLIRAEEYVDNLRSRINKRLVELETDINKVFSFVFEKLKYLLPEFLSFFQITATYLLDFGLESDLVRSISFGYSLIIFAILVAWKSGRLSPKGAIFWYSIFEGVILLTGFNSGAITTFPTILYYILSILVYLGLVARTIVEKEAGKERIEVKSV